MRGSSSASRDPGDGRKVLLDLTPLGRATLAELRAEGESWVADALAAGFTAGERRRAGARDRAARPTRRGMSDADRAPSGASRPDEARIRADMWYTDSRNASFLGSPPRRTVMTGASFAWPPLGDDQRELLALVHTLATERIAPRAAEIDETHEFPWDIVELYREQGLFGLFFEERHGGTGTGALLALAAIEEVSKVCATSGVILAVQELGSLALKLAGSEEQQARYLPRLASGELARRLRADGVGLGLGLGRHAHDAPSATATTTC